jgi:hypothetical protein
MYSLSITEVHNLDRDYGFREKTGGNKNVR